MPSCLVHLPRIPYDPVEIVGATAGLISGFTLPVHAVRDIVVLFAYRRSSVTTITKPAQAGTVPAWIDIDNNTGADANNSRSAYFVATATNHTAGSWGNAEMLVAVVLRGQADSPIGGHAESGGVGTAPVAPSFTLSNTDGTSAVLTFYGTKTTVTWDITPPVGYTRRAEYDAPSNLGGALVNSKDNTTTVDAPAQGTTASIGYRGQSIEVRSHWPFELASPVTFDIPGSYTYFIPKGATKVDRIVLGGGASGYNSGPGAAGGGTAGLFAWDTLELGVDFDEGDVITGIVGAGGSGDNNPGIPSTATVNGNTLTGDAPDGSAGAGTPQGAPVSSGNINSGKDVSLNGQLYEGGLENAIPGGGGRGGGGSFQGSQTGKRGQVWFYAHN